MKCRVGALLCALMMLMSGTVLSSSVAGAQPADRAASASARVSLNASTDEVDEGDVVRLTARIKSASEARKAVLQHWVKPLYDGVGTAEWQALKTVSARGKRRVKFGVTATEKDSEKYRVLVSYEGVRKPATSSSAVVKVWRWVPVSDFVAYFSTSLTGISEALMNGQRYETWGSMYSSDKRAWESRVTPGRNCSAFRGVAGVTDISADGSSAVIAFTVDDVELYRTGSLTPGMTEPIVLPLTSLPYRFGLQATNTSPDEVGAFPVVGNGEFRCSGL